MPNLCSKPWWCIRSLRYSVTGMLESNREVLKYWNQKQTAFPDLHYTCDTEYSCIATRTAKALKQMFGMLTQYSYRPGGFLLCVPNNTSIAFMSENQVPAGLVDVHALLGG